MGIVAANELEFSITAADLKEKKDFFKNLRRAIKSGLSEQDALKALTYSPASFIKQYDILGSLEEAVKLYRHFYKDAVFTFISNEELHLKQVVNTSKCLIHLHRHDNKLLITSCIDNLLKGASGQAVQNMNLMFGFEETEGLKLKATYF